MGDAWTPGECPTHCIRSEGVDLGAEKFRLRTDTTSGVVSDVIRMSSLIPLRQPSASQPQHPRSETYQGQFPQDIVENVPPDVEAECVEVGQMREAVEGLAERDQSRI